MDELLFGLVACWCPSKTGQLDLVKYMQRRQRKQAKKLAKRSRK